MNVDWLPPLLQRLAQGVDGVRVRYSPRAVMPVIDVINADTFDYTSSPLVRGGFNWGLHFKWDNLPKGTLTGTLLDISTVAAYISNHACINNSSIAHEDSITELWQESAVAELFELGAGKIIYVKLLVR